MKIDKIIKDQKTELLSYFRDRASEALTVIKSKFADTQADKRARAINESLNQTKSVLITTILQQAEKEKWSNKEKLESILMVTYCNIVVMIESRNSVRPYEYMDFSRRVGELWDPFCKLCFYYIINRLVAMKKVIILHKKRYAVSNQCLKNRTSMAFSDRNERKEISPIITSFCHEL